MMIGVDLTNISRFENKDEKFVSKILHPQEIIEYNKAADKALFLARYWSIKEALYKSDNKLFKFNEIYISKKDDKKYNYNNYLITTSREGDLYISFVLKEGDEKDDN